MKNTLQFALGESQGGNVINKNTLSDILTAAQGGKQTQDYFNNLDIQNNFVKYVSQNGDNFSIQSTDKNGFPIIYISQGDMTLTVAPKINPKILDGTASNSDLVGFHWNGDDYNIVGTISITIQYKEENTHIQNITIGAINLISVSSLLKIA